MRRLISLTVLALALAAPAVGYAVVGGSDDGTLSVKGGIGRVYLNVNGTVVGRLAKGSIQVVDPTPNDGSDLNFFGCDTAPHEKGTSTWGCTSDGKNGVVRFRAVGGKYLITTRGSGIFLSVVGHGYATLNGAGDLLDSGFDGTYSLNDSPYKSLPDSNTPVPLSAPSGG